ncbi:hypothetical protein AKJ16_DCAP15519 [Drosera capensis]
MLDCRVLRSVQAVAAEVLTKILLTTIGITGSGKSALCQKAAFGNVSTIMCLCYMPNLGGAQILARVRQSLLVCFYKFTESWKNSGTKSGLEDGDWWNRLLLQLSIDMSRKHGIHPSHAACAALHSWLVLNRYQLAVDESLNDHIDMIHDEEY